MSLLWSIPHCLQGGWEADMDFRKLGSRLFVCIYGSFGRRSCPYVTYEFFWSGFTITLLLHNWLSWENRTIVKICLTNKQMNKLPFASIEFLYLKGAGKLWMSLSLISLISKKLFWRSCSSCCSEEVFLSCCSIVFLYTILTFLFEKKGLFKSFIIWL